MHLGQDSVGSRLRMLDKDGKSVAMLDISGGEARGGQASLSLRFTLPPGTYKLEVRGPSGKSGLHDVVVAETPLRVRLGVKDEPPAKK